MPECLQVKEILDRIRAKISNKLHTPQNPQGCLMGTVDEYIEVYDRQVDRLKTKLKENREFLVEQVRRSVELTR